MEYAHTKTTPRNWKAKNSWRFWDTNGSFILDQGSCQFTKKEDMSSCGLHRSNGSRSNGSRVKIKTKKINKYLDVVSELKKSSGNCSWFAWIGPQRIGKRIGTIENQGKNLDHPDNWRPAETCCRSDSCRNLPANARSKMIMMIIIIIIIMIWSHKLYRENHENLENGIDSRKEKHCWSKNPNW